DKLGAGDTDAACLTCHDDPGRNPGKLKIAGGKFVDITGDVSLVCYQCHEAKYKEFKQGTHGKHFASCVAAGCHDPHTPNYIYVSPLRPFIGTGFQIRAVGANRVPFKPLMSPPLPPATTNPTWFLVEIWVGLFLVFAIFIGLAAPPILERLKR
ncbi:MAG TPA: cytochrome c3 family protein, partial [Coriobacteriia bacterium]